MKMNKRGDIPMILLAIIALILVILALWAMASFDSNLANDSQGRSEILGRIVFLENYAVKKTQVIAYELIGQGGIIKTSEGLKERFQEIARERNYRILGMENYYGKILRGEFDFSRDDDKYWFEMNDLELTATSGASFITRRISIRIEFDYSGDVLKIERNFGIRIEIGNEALEDRASFYESDRGSSYDPFIEMKESIIANWLKIGEEAIFLFGNEKHRIRIIDVTEIGILLELSSNTIEFFIKTGEEKLIDFNEDGNADIKIVVLGADSTKGEVLFRIESQSRKVIWDVVEGDKNSIEVKIFPRSLLSLEEDYNPKERIYLLLDRRQTKIYFENGELYIEESFIFDFFAKDNNIGEVVDGKYIRLYEGTFSGDIMKNLINPAVGGNDAIDYADLIRGAQIDKKKIIPIIESGLIPEFYMQETGISFGSELWEKAKRGELIIEKISNEQMKDTIVKIEEVRTDFLARLQPFVRSELEKVPFKLQKGGTAAMTSSDYIYINLNYRDPVSYTSLVHEYLHAVYFIFVNDGHSKRRVINFDQFKIDIEKYVNTPEDQNRPGRVLGSHSTKRESIKSEYFDTGDFNHLFTYILENYYLDKKYPLKIGRVPEYVSRYASPFFR